MATIEEIIKDAKFVEWSSSEQRALTKMIYACSNKGSWMTVVGRTDRVMTTFLRILDTHLPEKEV